METDGGCLADVSQLCFEIDGTGEMSRCPAGDILGNLFEQEGKSCGGVHRRREAEWQ